MNITALSKRLLLFLMLTAVLVTGCTDDSSPPANPQQAEQSPVKQEQTVPVEGGELVMGAVSKLPAFDPYGVSKKETELHEWEKLTYRGLLTHGDDYSLQPALAESYKIDRSGPKPAVVVTLRKGAVWSDGKPVTVEDVVFTYHEYARPHYYGVWRKWSHLLDGVSPYRTGKAQAITGITADAAQGTVRFVLARDDVSFLQSLTAPLLPKHQLQGKSIGEIDTLSREGKIIGAGPYQIASLAASEWRYRSNAGYYEGKPRLTSVRVIPVAPERVAEEIAAGRVHISWTSPDAAHRLREAGEKAAAVQTASAHGYHLVGFNLQHPVLRDGAVRRALAQAIPREQILQELFYGLAQSADGPLAPGSFADAAGEKLTYNPDQARQVLAQKGFTETKPLQLSFIYPSGNGVREQLANRLIAAWEQLPVTITKQGLPPEAFAAHLFGGKPMDLYLYAWEYPADPAELIELFHSREKVGELGLNASRYANKQADQLLERGQLLLAADERKKVFAELQQQIARDLPIVPLVQIPNHYMISAHLKGVERLGLDPFRQVHTWWIQP